MPGKPGGKRVGKQVLCNEQARPIVAQGRGNIPAFSHSLPSCLEHCDWLMASL